MPLHASMLRARQIVRRFRAIRALKRHKMPRSAPQSPAVADPLSKIGAKSGLRSLYFEAAFRIPHLKRPRRWLPGRVTPEFSPPFWIEAGGDASSFVTFHAKQSNPQPQGDQPEHAQYNHTPANEEGASALP